MPVIHLKLLTFLPYGGLESSLCFMAFGISNQISTNTGTILEKQTSQTFFVKYRGLKQVTIVHGNFFLSASVVMGATSSVNMPWLMNYIWLLIFYFFKSHEKNVPKISFIRWTHTTTHQERIRTKQLYFNISWKSFHMHKHAVHAPVASMGKHALLCWVPCDACAAGFLSNMSCVLCHVSLIVCSAVSCNMLWTAPVYFFVLSCKHTLIYSVFNPVNSSIWPNKKIIFDEIGLKASFTYFSRKQASSIDLTWKYWFLRIQIGQTEKKTFYRCALWFFFSFSYLQVPLARGRHHCTSEERCNEWSV